MNNSVNFNFAVDEELFKKHLESIGWNIKEQYSDKNFYDVFNSVLSEESFKEEVGNFIYEKFKGIVSCHAVENMDRNCWQ